jgi:hypothetical protein
MNPFLKSRIDKEGMQAWVFIDPGDIRTNKRSCRTWAF